MQMNERSCTKIDGSFLCNGFVEYLALLYYVNHYWVMGITSLSIHLPFSSIDSHSIVLSCGCHQFPCFQYNFFNVISIDVWPPGQSCMIESHCVFVKAFLMG